MVANPETANRYFSLEISFKIFIQSCQFQRIAPSIKTTDPPISPHPHSSSPPYNKEPPLGPAVPHPCSSSSLPVPIILSTYILSTIPVGEVEHYTAECLMSRWCPFSSNVLIQSSSIFDHLRGESSLHREENGGNSPGRKQPS